MIPGSSVPIADRAFESLTVGETASLVAEVEPDAVDAFARLSGDHNPLHTDAAYARRTRFRRRIAHGQLVAAPISALAGHLLPGRRCLLLEVRCKFLHPVFPGDRLAYHGTVTHVSTATRAVKVRVEVSNQDGVVVLRGSYEGQVLPDEAAPTPGDGS